VRCSPALSAIAALAGLAALPSAAAASDAAVDVELHADSPVVRLDRIVDGVAVPACFAPCRLALPRDGVYVIGGPGVQPTKPFTLSGDVYGHTTLEVRAGSSLRFQIGMAATTIGAIAFLGGEVSAAVIGFHDLATRPDDAPREPWPSRLAIVGLAGIPVLITGVILVLTSPTRVTTSNGVRFSLRLPGRIHAAAIALTPRGLEF
jgi:hypothetical protein